jgi:hypothetical protein
MKRRIRPLLAALIILSLTTGPAVAQQADQPQEDKPLTDQQLGIRDAEGKRIVPFYGLYCWASDFANPRYTDLILQTGFRLISSTLGESQEPGMLLAARHGIQVAGYFSPNRWARTGDVEGYRQAVREAED